MRSCDPRPGAGLTTRNRAFALPIVILVALVASLAIGVMLQRSGVNNTAVQRQIDNYKQHHRHAGMREMIEQWLATTHGTVRDQLESDGQAFVLDLPRGGRVRVTVTDGQGTILDDMRGVYGPESRYLRTAVESLHALVGQDNPEAEARIFRKVGPAKISVNSAPNPVIEAMATAIIPGRDGQRLATEFIAARNRSVVTSADLRSIALQQSLSPDDVAAVELMFTAEPTVWQVDCVEAGSNGFRAGGLIDVAPQAQGPQSSQMGPRTRFLTWEELLPR